MSFKQFASVLGRDTLSVPSKNLVFLDSVLKLSHKDIRLFPINRDSIVR